ncbi:HSF-type DNA-binding-domain-containing protein [Phlyctochytrium arcticum]|nr:HSF-type DNA-binding-domain-containing protein [Phlyctochytrium arcticum]
MSTTEKITDISISSANSSQAAFINKLYSMLEDVAVQHLICWDPTGTYFIVTSITDFSKMVLPQYFKHNNFASFVRQLNMYGFHKINDMYHGISSETWEFQHAEFRRGEVDRLQNIKRKSSKLTQQQRAAASIKSMSSKDEAIEMLTNKIMELEEKLAKVHESNSLLWSETVACRLLQSKHHQVITNVTSFLASIYHDEGANVSQKRKFDVDILQAQVAKMSPQKSVSEKLTNLEDPIPPQSNTLQAEKSPRKQPTSPDSGKSESPSDSDSSSDFSDKEEPDMQTAGPSHKRIRSS